MTTLGEAGRAAAALLLATASATAQSARPQPARPLDPIQAILSAFDSHSVVALSEGTHGNSQAGPFQLALIRDPRFSLRVNDIVIEGGNTRYQNVVDRYVAGEDVSIETLLRTWDESTQVQPVGPTWTGRAPDILIAVRELNRTLPPARRLRVLVSDPPMNWNDVHTPQDHARWIAERDTFPAELIEREVLARSRRALLIFGNMHLQRKQLLANFESAASGPTATVVSAIEQTGRRTRVFSIWTATDAELADVQPDVARWPIPTPTGSTR